MSKLINMAINKPRVTIKFSSKVNALKPSLAGEGLGEEIPNKQLFYLIFQKLKECLFLPHPTLSLWRGLSKESTLLTLPAIS